MRNPDPSFAVVALTRTLLHLVEQCGWPADRIHLFGFAQGGTVAAETILRWSRLQSGQSKTTAPLASFVSVGGPLLSFPTLSKEASSARCPTPVLYVHRSGDSKSVTTLRRGYSEVRETKLGGLGGGGEESMPKSRDEWQRIMQFWSERLHRRVLGADGGGSLYEVLTGTG